MLRTMCTWWLVSLAGLFFTPSLLRAGGDLDIGRDVLHTVLARAVLLQDKELGLLNLGVKVVNRVAVLWGPVPSAELASRAVVTLEKLPDLIAVKNELHIVPDAERPLYLPERLPEESKLPSGSKGVLATRTKNKSPVKVEPAGWQGTQTATNVESTSLPAVQEPEKTAWQTVPAKKDPRMPDQTEIEFVLPALRIATPLVFVSPPPGSKSLDQAIRDLKQDKRFVQIQVEVQGSIIYLSGDPLQTPSLYEMAQTISRLAGVERVVIKEN